MKIFNEKNILIERIVVGAYQVNCYILTDEKNKLSAIIDPGDEAEKIIKYIDSINTTVVYIIFTHGHFDHIMACDILRKKYNSKIIISVKEAKMLKNSETNLSSLIGYEFTTNPDILIKENEIIKIGDISLKVKETPGHTLGSIILIHEKFVFSGDTLFSGSIGRTDFPGGDLDSLLFNIKSKIMTLKADVNIFPGHGEMTTVKYEKEFNIFLNE